MENAIETPSQPIATEETEVKVSTGTNEDLEAKYNALQEELVKTQEREANYKKAYLKEKGKHADPDDDSEPTMDVRSIVREELSNSRLADILREKEEITKKALKENSEMKRALSNKQGIQTQAATGSHVESRPVTDTLVTPEQAAHFKSRGWSDKDIEQYKKNLRKKI